MRQLAAVRQELSLAVQSRERPRLAAAIQKAELCGLKELEQATQVLREVQREEARRHLKMAVERQERYQWIHISVNIL